MPDSTLSGDEPGTASPAAAVAVFQGSRAACLEFGLVLDATGFAYEVTEGDALASDPGAWSLRVDPQRADAARVELERYAAERVVRREPPLRVVPFGGALWGATGFAGLLIAVAYCAGIGLFQIDWFAAGALERRPNATLEWWRAVTALTLHVDQEHLLGNLLFGMGIGTLAGRMFGPGFAWLGIVIAAAAANLLDMTVSPSGVRAVGASTAVFAALGLLSGFGWSQRRGSRERRFYRFAPLIAGICLLALLGAGDAHVDVLGHLLGFAAGTALGWVWAGFGLPRERGMRRQWLAGIAAVALVVGAWWLALRG